MMHCGTERGRDIQGCEWNLVLKTQKMAWKHKKRYILGYFNNNKKRAEISFKALSPWPFPQLRIIGLAYSFKQSTFGDLAGSQLTTVSSLTVSVSMVMQWEMSVQCPPLNQLFKPEWLKEKRIVIDIVKWLHLCIIKHTQNSGYSGCILLVVLLLAFRSLTGVWNRDRCKSLDEKSLPS